MTLEEADIGTEYRRGTYERHEGIDLSNVWVDLSWAQLPESAVLGVSTSMPGEIARTAQFFSRIQQNNWIGNSKCLHFDSFERSHWRGI